MGLCIAKIIEGEIMIHVDGLVTGESIRRHQFSKHTVLKAILLTQNICLLFAGNIEPMNVILELFYKRRGYRYGEIISFFQNQQMRYDNSIDFVLASHLPDCSEIVELKNGEVKRNMSSSWIGSIKAFNRFQEEWIKLNKIGIDKKRSFEKAFSAVIYDDAIAEVGNVKFSLKTYNNKFNQSRFFNYVPEISIYPSAQRTKVELDSFGIASSTSSTVENGGYAYTILPSNSLGQTGVGIYFGFTQLGMFYFPRKHGIEPIIFKTSIEDFIKGIKKLGIEVRGVIFSNEGHQLKKVN